MIDRALLAGVGSLVAAAVAAVAFLVPASRASPDVATLDGASIFRAKGCATCHSGPDSSAPLTEFPSLVDAADWAGTRVGGLTAAEYIEQSVRDPVAFISPEFEGGVGPATAMPTLALSDDEVEALVAYLLASPATDQQD